MIKKIKPINDIVTKCTIELGNKYEEERKKLNLLKKN